MAEEGEIQTLVWDFLRERSVSFVNDGHTDVVWDPLEQGVSSD